MLRQLDADKNPTAWPSQTPSPHPTLPTTCAAHPGPTLPSTFEEGTPARDGAGGAGGGLLGLLGQAHRARRPCRAHGRPQLHQGQVVVEGPRVKLRRGWQCSVNEVRGRLPLPTLRSWGLPSHLGVGQDAVHRYLLRFFPAGPLGQRHGPQKLVLGAAGREEEDTQDKDAVMSPGDPALRPRVPPSDPARRAASPPGGREGGLGRGRGTEWVEHPGRCVPEIYVLLGRQQERLEGRDRVGTAARGQQRPALARGTRPTTTEELNRGSGPGRGLGADVPREAVRRREHPGCRHQDAAAQRLPTELQPHQPGPGPWGCSAAPHNAAVGPRHVDSARVSLSTRT